MRVRMDAMRSLTLVLTMCLATPAFAQAPVVAQIDQLGKSHASTRR